MVIDVSTEVVETYRARRRELRAVRNHAHATGDRRLAYECGEASELLRIAIEDELKAVGRLQGEEPSDG